MAAPTKCLRAMQSRWKVLIYSDICTLPVVYQCRRGFTGNNIPPKPECRAKDKDGFRIFRIPGYHQTTTEEWKKAKRPTVEYKSREKRMAVDQDWTSVWPTAETFKPSVVPLPIRQGYIKNSGENGGITPDKYSNLELMKVTNFLHLTPRHIKKHCAALQKFCTPWPGQLYDEETYRQHFPLSVITRDYVHSGPSLRDPRSRKVTMKFALSCLDMNRHAKDKLIRLLGDRYDKKSNLVTLEADVCPVRNQNTDYLHYLLTALYYESWKTEEWESEQTWADLAHYEYNKSKSKTKIESLVEKLPHASSDQWKKKSIRQYAKAVEQLHNRGEDSKTLEQYKKAVMNLLKLKTKSQQADDQLNE